MKEATVRRRSLQSCMRNLVWVLLNDEENMPWLRQKNESCSDGRRCCSYSLMHAGLELLGAVRLKRSVWPI